MLSKEKSLKEIDLAYQKIVISSREFETKEFTNAINKGCPEDRRRRIAEFIQTYQRESLFVNYENMLKHYKSKQILNILLSDMEDAKKDFFLYLYVPQEKVDIIKAHFDEVYNYKKEWIVELFDKYDDDEYVIKIDDKRSSKSFNYLKIYPDGKVYLFIDSEFSINREEFYLDEDLKKELISEIKNKVNKILKDKKYLACDDREFLRMFALTYGFEWLGLTCDWEIDNEDYFLDKFPLKIVEKIMKIPTITEKFVNVKW